MQRTTERLAKGRVPRKGSSVDKVVAQQLRKLNAAFYETHAETFAATRNAAWPGWAHVPPLDGRVLDLGCGNGRYLRFLRKRGFSGSYVGVDSSASLIAKARAEFGETAEVKWHIASLEAALGERTERCAHVAAWGVLHHIPGEEARAQLIENMLSRLEPEGSLWFSLWQFRAHERFAKNECDAAAFGFAPADLEEGDALLDWQGNRLVPRYCHHFSDTEIDRICARFASASPRVFRTESGSDRFNVYVALTP